LRAGVRLQGTDDGDGVVRKSVVPSYAGDLDVLVITGLGLVDVIDARATEQNLYRLVPLTLDA
jgi:hypothetical protein